VRRAPEVIEVPRAWFPRVGDLVRIRAAYDGETRARTRADEYTGAEGQVSAIDGDDVLINLPTGSAVWVHRGRVE
jgi:hypothetical protein